MTISSDELVRRNAAFAATGGFAGLPFPTNDTLQVLGCVDSRVDPGDVLGLELGEGVVMRNIGGRITPATDLESKAVADPYAAVRVDTAIARLHALLGGLHLSGAFFTPAIALTVHALTELAPDLLAPGHCTGWRAQHALAAALPDSWIQSSSGTRYQLTAALPRLTRHRRTDPARVATYRATTSSRRQNALYAAT